jgi:DnaJ-class molecular chaperone
MPGPPSDHDHYRVLGIARAATAAEIRRAYRQLALRHHPDRAGAGATAQFQRISLAYRVLSNPVARAAYDSQLPGPITPGDRPAPGAATGTRPAPFRALDDLIERLAAPLDALITRGAARRGLDGVIDLLLTRDEARRGGTAVLGVPTLVPCPTCGGCAQPSSFWCVRCEFAGSIVEEVAVCIAIPPLAPAGATFTVRVDPLGQAPPLRVRLNVVI